MWFVRKKKYNQLLAQLLLAEQRIDRQAELLAAARQECKRLEWDRKKCQTTTSSK